MFVLVVCVVSTARRGVDAADFLFVQTASGATLNGTLTMTGVGQDTTYFSDRPVRVAGRTSTEEFLTLFEPSGTFSEDPPNGALECKVNGVATTTVIIITAPVLMTDEIGAMSLDYDVELVGMTRGGPTVFNTTASAESVDEEELVCD